MFFCSSGSHVSSHHTLRHQRRNISGGDLPPTPPTHSRTSSSSHSVNITTLSPLQTPAQSTEDVQSRASPTTPPNQRSPPTPEVTPPRTAIRPKPPSPSPRPALYDRIPSKCTTDSRTESFRTALESPEVSDAEDSRSTLRPAARSARTSQITVRQFSNDDKKSQRGSGVWSGAESNTVHGVYNLTPKSKREFNTFDGEWGSGSEVEQEWDDNLMRNVTVRKRRPEKPGRREKPQKVLDDSEVSPSNPNKAARGLPLKGRILTYEPAELSPRNFTAPETASTEASMSGDLRRLSGMSTKSNASTVVGAILVDRPPRRLKTLRHVRRVDALRDSLWQPSPLGSTMILQENVARRRPTAETREVTRESLASTSSTNSLASRKARRDVWKSGGIPVVVVPDRHASNRSNSRDRSLHSTSSKRSDRRPSTGSTPASHISKEHDLTPYFERPSRRGRTMSESDGSTPGDQRTIDYPPVVPRRTSSLSAPTSRNGSREGSRSGSRAASLTTERLEAHNASVETIGTSHAPKHSSQVPSSSLGESSIPRVTVHTVPSSEQLKSEGPQGGSEEHHDKNLDSMLGSPLLPAQTTPFSQTSVETNGTAPEISEAMAVSISTHQNRSILMVDHRPSDSSDGDPRSQGEERAERPTITTTTANGTSEEAEPITPPQAQPLYSLHSVDSPLRNPRAPPEPPALQFIPATPSGLTPAEERPKLLGNFYEATEEKPARGLSKVRRALGSRRHSSYGSPAGYDSRPGFLTRTFSLGKRMRRNAAEDSEPEYDDHVFSYEDPIDETRLHPDWRPTNSGHYGDESTDDYDMGNDETETIRYPPIDNRPRPAKRTLSERMKRTFAIMPLRDADDVYVTETEPERRTIRRTPSGSLRVVKQRGSEESLRERKSRPPNSAETRRRPFFRRSSSLGKNSYESGESDTDSSQRTSRRGRTWSLSGSLPGISRRLSEKRREKRSNELRQKISGPRTVRDGVGEVIQHESLRDAFYHPGNAGVPVRG